MKGVTPYHTSLHLLFPSSLHVPYHIPPSNTSSSSLSFLPFLTPCSKIALLNRAIDSVRRHRSSHRTRRYHPPPSTPLYTLSIHINSTPVNINTLIVPINPPYQPSQPTHPQVPPTPPPPHSILYQFISIQPLSISTPNPLNPLNLPTAPAAPPPPTLSIHINTPCQYQHPINPY